MRRDTTQDVTLACCRRCMLPTVQQRGYISYVVTLECMCDMRFKSGQGVGS